MAKKAVPACVDETLQNIVDSSFPVGGKNILLETSTRSVLYSKVVTKSVQLMHPFPLLLFGHYSTSTDSKLLLRMPRIWTL